MEKDNKTEIHRDKRIKLDNNNNNNNNNDDKNNNEIDVSILSKKTVKELKVIASSLAITIKSSARKNEIIERVKLVIKRKQKSLEKQKYSENVNSFNKEIIEFKIKDGIDPSEWLFWKIFRNKFIFRRIMSFMDTQFTPEYDSINSISDMIESNQLGILRDKVIRNQYLKFKLFDIDGSLDDYEYFLEYQEDLLNGIIKITNDTFKIFNCIKSDNDQDRLFYHHFFKNYSKNILGFNATIIHGELIMDGRNDRERLVNDIIDNKCLPALQILIQDYQYEFTELNLQYAINSGAKICIQFILQQKPIFKENINKILSNNLTTCCIEPFKPIFKEDINKILLNNLTTLYIKPKSCCIKSIISLIWLQNENIIDFNDKDGVKGENILLQYIKSVHIQINESTPLKSLIFICQLLLKLTVSTNYEGTCNNSIINNEEIESFSNKLTKQELKLPLSDVSNQIDGKKLLVLKLLNLYYSISKIQTKSLYYHLFFNDENIIDFLYDSQGNIKFEPQSYILMQIKHSLRHGDFELLEKSIKKFRYLDYDDKSGEARYLPYESTNLIYSSSKGELFSCCTGENNKEKRLEFTNSLIKNLIESNEQERILNHLHGSFNLKESINDPLYKSGQLLNLLVEFDDPELVNQLFVNAVNNNFVFSISFHSNLTAFIKSSEMLELIFNRYRTILELGLLQFKSIPLLQMFESLVSSSPIKIIQVPDLRITNFTCSFPSSSIEVLKHIISNSSSIYIFNSFSSVYNSIDKHFSSNDKFKMLKLFFLNYQIKNSNNQVNEEHVEEEEEDVDNHLKFHFRYNSLEFAKFLDWLFINHNDYLKNNNIDNSKLDEYQDGIRFEIYFITGRLDQLNGNIPLNKFQFSISNINQLDFICNKIKNTNANSEINKRTISDIHFFLLKSLVSKGKLKMLEHIQLNYPWLLKSKNGNGELSSLDPKKLKCLLYHPLQNNNLLMAEFLFEFLSLTKKEFNDCSSFISQVYFNNKQF